MLYYKNNAEIRRTVARHHLHLWQLAEEVGVSPQCLSVWLRHELEGERLQRVQTALDSLTVKR